MAIFLLLVFLYRYTVVLLHYSISYFSKCIWVSTVFVSPHWWNVFIVEFGKAHVFVIIVYFYVFHFFFSYSSRLLLSTDYTENVIFLYYYNYKIYKIMIIYNIFIDLIHRKYYTCTFILQATDFGSKCSFIPFIVVQFITQHHHIIAYCCVYSR